MVPQNTKNFVVYLLWFLVGIISVLILEHGNSYTFYMPTYSSYNKPLKFHNDRRTKSTRGSMNLLSVYETYNGSYLFDHWKEYASKYETNLYSILRDFPSDKTFRMLEIGVQSGGSVQVWKSYFHSRAFYYVGMDIEKRCKRSEDIENNIFIEIGSQLKPTDLMNICKKHGPFHFIVDDGGHTFEMMQTALKTLFISDQCMVENSLYVIEDMHTMVKSDLSRRPTDIPSIPGELFRMMHYYWYQKLSKTWKIELQNEKDWADRIRSITLYDSMMFIRRQHGHGPLTRIRKGSDSFPNDERKLQPKSFYKDNASEIEWGWKQW